MKESNFHITQTCTESKMLLFQMEPARVLLEDTLWNTWKISPPRVTVFLISGDHSAQMKGTTTWDRKGDKCMVKYKAP